MGKLLPQMGAVTGLDAIEVDCLFSEYENRQKFASTEGLSNVATNIAITFSDFVIRIGNNIKTGVSGIFKDIKRSSLQELLQSNRLGMSRVLSADYTKLIDMKCYPCPFTVKPSTFAAYCKENFITIDIAKRLPDIIDQYMLLGASIRVGDIDKAVTIMMKIDNLNMKHQLHINENLIKMIASTAGVSNVEFGKIFDSTAEFKSAVELTAVQGGELDIAIKSAKLLDTLYKSFYKLHEAITHAASTEMELSKLTGVAVIINDTGKLIESYAMLIREYHHLEHFLTTISISALSLMKKE